MKPAVPCNPRVFSRSCYDSWPLCPTPQHSLSSTLPFEPIRARCIVSKEKETVVVGWPVHISHNRGEDQNSQDRQLPFREIPNLKLGEKNMGERIAGNHAAVLCMVSLKHHPLNEFEVASIYRMWNTRRGMRFAEGLIHKQLMRIQQGGRKVATNLDLRMYLQNSAFTRNAPRRT